MAPRELLRCDAHFLECAIKIRSWPADLGAGLWVAQSAESRAAMLSLIGPRVFERALTEP